MNIDDILTTAIDRELRKINHNELRKQEKRNELRLHNRNYQIKIKNYKGGKK